MLNKDEYVSELDLCDEMTERLKSEIRIVEGDFELNQDEIEIVKEKFSISKSLQKKRRLPPPHNYCRSVIWHERKCALVLCRKQNIPVLTGVAGISRLFACILFHNLHLNFRSL